MVNAEFAEFSRQGYLLFWMFDTALSCHRFEVTKIEGHPAISFFWNVDRGLYQVCKFNTIK